MCLLTDVICFFHLKALSELLEDIATNFEKTKPGFATSIVEAFWSTHDSFWAKGHAYKFEIIEMRMTLQMLHWNRVLNWPTIVYEKVLPFLHHNKD